MRKKAAVVLGAVALLLVAAVLVLSFAFDANRYRAVAQAALAGRLGRAVTLGQMRLSIVPFGIRVENVTIAEDAAFRTGRPFAQVKELYVTMQLLPLLRRQVEVRSFELRQPVIELVHNTNGAWNFARLGGNAQSDAGQSALVLEHLAITGGQVAVTDGGARAVYSNIDVQLDNYGPGRVFDVVLATPLPGSAARLALSGKAGPLTQGEIAKTPFEGTLRLDAGDVGDILKVARDWGVQAAEGVTGTGRLTLNIRAAGLIEALQYAGSASLSDATLKVPSLTQPLRVRTADATIKGDTASLSRLAFSLGKTSAEGSLTVRDLAAPKVEFQLSLDRVDVAEMQNLVAPAAGAPSSSRSSGKADESLLMLATGSGRVSIGTIANQELVLEKVQATATLDRGRIRLDPLTAALFGGQYKGSITVDARRVPATFDMASVVEKVDADKLASAATNLREVIFGALASTARVTASAGSTDALARSLNGTLSLNLADGRIGHMSLISEIGSIGKFIAARNAEQRMTPVKSLTGSFTVTNGLAQTDDLKAAFEEGSLSAAGSVNLVDQSVNLRVTAVLTPEYSQRVGGTKIGGFMTTALANQQGELIVPLLMTGTMQQPRFAPDVKRVAEMKLKNLVPNLPAPAQGLQDRLRGLLNRGK